MPVAWLPPSHTIPDRTHGLCMCYYLGNREIWESHELCTSRARKCRFISAYSPWAITSHVVSSLLQGGWEVVNSYLDIEWTPTRLFLHKYGREGKEASNLREREGVLRWEALQIVIDSRGQWARGKGVEGNTELAKEGRTGQGKVVMREEGFH